jgi:plastocyanin
MRRARALVVAVLLLALAVPAVASESPEDRRGGGPARVRMVGSLRFRPPSLTVQAGTRVRWANVSGVHHTTTSDTGRWDSGHVAPGDVFTRRFRSEGTFRYHCTIHASMRGTIVVT